MEFQKFVEWAFYGIMGGAAVWGVSLLAGLKNSVEKLNQQIAVIIEKTAWHEKWLERHDEEIAKIKRVES